MSTDFASTVLPADYVPEWFHLRNEDNSLVQLYSKFWGKSLTCESLTTPTKSVDKDRHGCGCGCSRRRFYSGLCHPRYRYRKSSIPKDLDPGRLHSSLQLPAYEDDLRKTINGLTPEALEKLFDEAGTLETGKLLSRICLISRDTLEDVASPPIVKPITLHVRSQLVCHLLRTISPCDQLLLYRRFAKTSDYGEFVRIAFEVTCQAMLAMLQVGDCIRLVPISMPDLPTKPDTQRPPPWYSCHVKQRDKHSEQLRETPIYPSKIFAYSENNRLSIEPKVLYVPALSNPALDMFILLKDILFIFQFSIVHPHQVKPRLKDFLATCSNTPSTKNWRSVLFIPSNKTLISPVQVPSSTIPLYSAVIPHYG